MTSSRPRIFAAICLFACTGELPVFAQDKSEMPAPYLAVELNKASPTGSGCRLSFVSKNGLNSDLTRITFEMAFFDRDGGLQRMSVLDFRELPKGRTKIRQFALPETNCSQLGRVLVNDVPVCEGVGETDCYESLALSSRLPVEFGR